MGKQLSISRDVNASGPNRRSKHCPARLRLSSGFLGLSDTDCPGDLGQISTVSSRETEELEVLKNSIIRRCGASGADALENLIRECGSFVTLLGVAERETNKNEGVRKKVLGIIAVQRTKRVQYLRQLLSFNPIHAMSRMLYEYLLLDFALSEVEKIRLIGLDRENIINYERIFIGKNQGFVYASLSKISSEILNLDIKSVFIIHNHPNGSSAPSLIDIINTNKIMIFLKQKNIELYDHIIITTTGWTSMKSCRFIV